MNKELTQVYAGTCVFDNKDYAEHHLSRLGCSKNNWSVKQVNIETEVIKPTQEIEYKRKWYHPYEYCSGCFARNDKHDMNCVECCPVKMEKPQINCMRLYNILRANLPAEREIKSERITKEI